MSDDKEAPFAPPAGSIEVECIHCGEIFDSWQMQLRNEGPDNEPAWCCPTPGCDGLGFCFDVWPTDREWRDENGELVWHEDADETEFDGVVDEAILKRYWDGDYWMEQLTHPNAGENIAIDFNGDIDPPLVRMFGESARKFLDDIPF